MNFCTDIALICTTLGVSTLASIIQQIFFAVNWRSLKNAEYQKALDNVGKPALVLVGVAGPEATSLYLVRTSSVNLLERLRLRTIHCLTDCRLLIEFYCYNVDALLIAFWYVTREIIDRSNADHRTQGWSALSRSVGLQSEMFPRLSRRSNACL